MKIPARGFLIHFSHYDPVWFKRKNLEKPFDLQVGLEIVNAVADVGLNVLAIDLDDGVVFNSHPELRRHYSVPMSHLKELVNCARDRGMEIIPKLNFSKSPQHHHNDWFSPHHQLEDTEEYWKLAFEVIDEVIDVCAPERYFFIGMDEDTQRSDEMYTKAIQALSSGLARRKLNPAMWNDSVHLGYGMFECVRKTLAAENSIHKSVVQTVWDYGPVRQYAIDRICDIQRKGFEVWIAPGANPDYVRAWKQVAVDTNCSGFLMTMWQPVSVETREAMLKRIRTLGPIYCEDGIKNRFTVPLAPGTRVCDAPQIKNAAAPVTKHIIAPNVLTAPCAQPYLLPSDVYLRNWMVLGPYTLKKEKYSGPQLQDSIDDDSFLKIPEQQLAAESEGTPESGAVWQRWNPPATEEFPHIVDLTKMYDGLEYAAAYLAAQVHASMDMQDCKIYFSSDDFMKVWLNGALLYQYNEQCRGITQDSDVVRGVTLRKGWNNLIVKCVNIRGSWGIIARIADSKDRPIATKADLAHSV